MTLSARSQSQWALYLNESRSALANVFDCGGTGELWVYKINKIPSAAKATASEYCFLTNPSQPDYPNSFLSGQSDQIEESGGLAEAEIKNPFAKQDEQIILVWHGSVIAEQADPSQEKRAEPQAIASGQLRVSLPFRPEIKAGQWAILEAWGAQLNGAIIEAGTISQPVTTIAIDLAQPLPFTTEMVGRTRLAG